jgi:putative transposase
MDLHAESLETVCLSAGIELMYMGVAHPELKGAIERMFRTLNQGLFHQLPGTVFSNPDERGEYAAEKLAALDLETLTQVLVKWIVDVYHNTPHRGLAGRTPLEVWSEEAQQRIIELPAYPHQLDTMVGHATTRTLFHYGVEFDSLRYDSHILQVARQRRGGYPEVQIRAYEHDVGYIDVLDAENNEFIRVPAIDKEYAEGLNRHVHRLVRAQVRRRFGDQWRQDQLRQAKAEIQAIVQTAIKAQKAGTRKRVAAVQLVDSEAALGVRTNDALGVASAPVNLDAADELLLESTAAVGDLPRFGVSAVERRTA